MGKKYVNNEEKDTLSNYFEYLLYDSFPAYTKEVDGKIIEFPEKTKDDIKGMSAKELRTYYDDLVKNYYELTSENKEDTISFLKNQGYGNLLITDNKQIKNRAELRNEASLNMWKAKLTYALVTTRFDTHDRTLSSMLEMDLSDAAFEKNQLFADTMKNGTPEQKKSAVSEKIEQIGRLNLNRIDYVDDAKFANHLESYTKTIILCDIQNTKQAAETYGIDLSEQRFKSFCEKSNAMSSVWYASKIKQSIVTSPFYDRIDVTKIDSVEKVEEITNKFETDSEIAIDPSLGADVGYISQIKSDNDISPMFDKTKTPAERIESIPDTTESLNLKTLSQQKETEFNNLTLEEKLKKVDDGDYILDTPDSYFSKEIRDNQKKLANKNFAELNSQEKILVASIVTAAEMRKEYTKDVLRGVDADTLKERYSQSVCDRRMIEMDNSSSFRSVLINEVTEREFNELKAGYSAILNKFVNKYETLNKHREELKNSDIKAYRRELLEDNIAQIKKYDSTFEITNEEKEKILSDERIQLHEQAKEFLKQYKDADNFLAQNKSGEIPPMFSRVVPYILDKGTDEKAQQKNRNIISSMTDTSFAGDCKRKDILVNVLNSINTIEPFNLEVENTDAKRFEKAKAQFSKCRLAFVCQGDLKNTDEVGFDLTDEAKERFNTNAKTLESISTGTMHFINLLASEDYLTMPTEEILNHFSNNEPKFLECVAKFHSLDSNKGPKAAIFSLHDVAISELPGDDVKINGFSHLDIKDTVPVENKVCYDFDGLTRKCAEFEKRLKEADHFYNLKNSKEYTDLLKSLDRAVFVFSRQKDDIDEKNGPQVYKTLRSVQDKANAYVEKYINATRNKTRQTRFDTCKEINVFVKKFVSPNPEKNPDNEYQKDLKFVQWTKLVNQTAVQKKNGTLKENILKQELEFADRKTASLEAVKKTFANNSTEKNAITDLALARKELTASIRNNTLNPERKTFLLATIACCSPLIKQGATPENLSKEDLSAMITRTASNLEFKTFTQKLDGTKIVKALGGYQDKAFEKECDKILGIERNAQAEKNQIDKDQLNRNSGNIVINV